uniref:Zgc:85777 n=1 Tax=Oncorhynchus kisutch TaxID=8019 RepID=A0A8C7MUP6_ONCKI
MKGMPSGGFNRDFHNPSYITVALHGGSNVSLNLNHFIFMLLDSCTSLCPCIIDQDINPYVDQWEAEGIFPAHKVFKLLGNAGFLGVNKPSSSYLISSLTTLSLCVVCIYCRFGSTELKKEFLLPSIMGDKVACLGVSEVRAGSDVASTLPSFSIPPVFYSKRIPPTPIWVHIARKIDKMGMRSSDTAKVFFDDVRVPCKNLIGQEGMGFTYQMLQFQEERLWACVLTMMDNIIQETIQYTRQSRIFKMPVLYHQSVHFRLAELETEIELLRSLLHRSTALYIKGNDVTKLASMAKLKAGRLSREVGDSCLQYWGGMGFTSDVLVSRFYRDARLLSIGGGADEVMLSIICKYMDTLPKK